ncbi:endonuclease/exonuclease/phosphatase family protein [Lysobacter sp. A6]|uniref:Endonuclease/exonuclease/phosphatase family protein n=1 Tax=Noviluteimonas lactosilytica TaxID=2888523 RepID=A0ABS8JIV6_9GAMM|nr:endonuclease/exonuclease/phosphatase family protein [Lysobacter lactosilyticus]
MPAATVLTLNCHMGFDLLKRRLVLHELREAVRSVSADVVFLQEVMGENALHKQKHAQWPDVPQYEFLADSLWSHAAYGRNAVYPHGHHGNALLSKFAIKSHRNCDVSIHGHEERGLLHCQLVAGDGPHPLHAICVHLGLRESHRREQLRLLGEVLEETVPRDAPLIVAGDFNDWRSRGHAIVAGFGLREVFVEAHGRLARTFPVRWPVLPVDRIYVRNVQVTEPRVLNAKPWTHLSDHAPLVAQVAW